MYKLSKNQDGWYQTTLTYGIHKDDITMPGQCIALTHSGDDIDFRTVPKTLNIYITAKIQVDCYGIKMEREGLIPYEPGKVYMNIRSYPSIYITEKKLGKPGEAIVDPNRYASSPRGELISKYIIRTRERNRNLGSTRNGEQTMIERKLCDKCDTATDCFLVNDEWLCAKCLEDMGYVRCDECGDWFDAHEIESFDNKNLCDSCFSAKYFECEDCGAIMPYEYAREVHTRYGTAYVCDDCQTENYTRCEDCQEYYDNNLMREDEHGMHLCDFCYDESWTTCTECGCFILTEDAYYDDSDDAYCEDCYNENGRELNYSYKPNPVFHKTPGESSDELMFGIENEVDNGFDKPECITDIGGIRDGDYIYCKHDGSLNDGFEMVSHPMTLRYHMEEMRWKRIFEIALTYNFRSHDTSTCGLHIHVGREQLGDDDVASKVIMLVERHWDNIERFTRRTQRRLEQWAARPDIHRFIEENPEASREEIINEINPRSTVTRYTAVNCCNYRTIEFRIFRGTLNHTSFLAAIQFTSNICKYARTHSWDDVFCSNWKDIALFEEYPELNAYLEKRGLMPENTTEEIDEGFDYDTGSIMPAIA